MLSPVRALLDANVLYSNNLRNLLLQLAQNDVFDARWSERIEQEWLRNMEPLTRQRIASSTIPLIRTWFTQALVTDFDAGRVIGATDPKDRHVASAAAAIAPSVLVTENLNDFDFAALAALGVALQTPDDFLTDMFDTNPALVEAATREAAANLTRTTPSWDEYLAALADRQGPTEVCRAPAVVEPERCRTADGHRADPERNSHRGGGKKRHSARRPRCRLRVMRVDPAARESFSVYHRVPTGFRIKDGIVTLAGRN
jgi:hypothetical protein